MTKYLLIGAAVLVLIVLGVFFLGTNPSKPSDPEMARLASLADLADRNCLSNTTDSRTAEIKVKLDAIKGVDASASVEARRKAARGASEALSAEIQKIENAEIRKCMEPWGQQIRDMAAKL